LSYSPRIFARLDSMMTAAWPLAIAVIGALVYAYTDKPKELGRIMFFCGFFWLTYLLLNHPLKW